MMPIFVRIYNDEGKIRDPYKDFYKLIDLAGFKTVEMEEIKRDSSNIYIFSPDDGNVKAFCEVPHTAKYILWQLERPGPIKAETPAYFDEMWVSDRYFRELVVSKNCKYVSLGGHKDFGTFSLNEPKKYDMAHISYEYGRRHEIYNRLRETYTFAPNGWGKERDEILRASKYLLCVHQDETPIIEPLRYTIAACYGLPIVGEHSKDSFPYKVCELDRGEQMREDRLKENAKYNYHLMTNELNFRDCVLANV